MKKQILITIAALFIGFTLCAQDNAKLKWYGFQEALELQKSNPKFILVDVYTDWCGWCKRMDAETFTNAKVIEYLNKYYYCVKFNGEGKDEINYGGQKFVNDGKYGRAHQFAVAMLNGKMSYPSIAYFDEKGTMLTAVPGYMSVDNIMPIISFFAEGHYKTKDFQAYSAEYKK